MKSIRLSARRPTAPAIFVPLGTALLLAVELCHGQQPSTPPVPSWWIERGVIDRRIQDNDSAPALQGQVKHVVLKGYEEMQYSLAPIGGAGDALTALVSSSWFEDSRNNHSPCQLGQLKTLVAPFYDRLRELNIDAGNRVTGGWLYPWTQEQDDDSDNAPALVGQLKRALSFDFDLDGDQLPDWWEARTFDTLEFTGSQDADADGLSNLEELLGGTNANLGDTDDDGLPDGVDAHPFVSDDAWETVGRDEGLEVFGGVLPANRELDAENQIRRRLELEEFRSLEESRESARQAHGQ